MELILDILKKEEQITLELRRLYAQWGYKKYKMSKFEEYDFYVENKNFLTSDHIITFTDMDGKLLALKPDVTLSIVKNTKADKVNSERLYYIENVYRLSKQNNEYREINQMGLEFLGEVDLYSTVEVVRLAISSLAKISEEFILEISHMAFISGLMEGLEVSEEDKAKLLACIKAKNSHELRGLAMDMGISETYIEKMVTLTSLYGDFPQTLKEAREIAINGDMNKALDELEELYEALAAMRFAKNLQLDFSTVNDIDYYSGIIFQGYVRGIPRPVLTGGRYDNLLRKFNKDIRALGFALYLNELEHYFKSPSSYDVEAVVLYDDRANLGVLSHEVQKLVNSGISVRVEKQIPEELRYNRVYRFRNGKLEEVAEDAEYSST